MKEYIPAVNAISGDLLYKDADDFKTGDFVTRDGSDIHYVLLDQGNDSLLHVVCVVPPNTDWCSAGEFEANLRRRYTNISRHYIPFAKIEFDKIKSNFPAEWFELYEVLKS